MDIIVPIVLIVLSLVSGVIMLIYKNRSKKTKDAKLSAKQVLANEFINVLDIKDRFLYTRDGQIIVYIKISPISIDLFSDAEKEQMCKVITAELSSIRRPFKFLAVSRPIDISPLINEYTELLAETTNQKQKELLRSEIMVVSSYATSGEVIERQFYIMLWDKYKGDIEKEILKEADEFVSKLASGNISSDVLREREIVRLCNLINNPAYITEDADFEKTIPILGGRK
ncbi:hypothetical protein JYU11_03305 [bacterium AH-315-G05]|nr:hypothetical protein [bacterium AH-315-G05]